MNGERVAEDVAAFVVAKINCTSVFADFLKKRKQLIENKGIVEEQYFTTEAPNGGLFQKEG